MCLILFLHAKHAAFQLVLGANRDEVYDRPTAPLGFWDDCPDILGGHDLKIGGTWMGITRTGRFAALTNLRDPALQHDGAPSRGLVVTDFLRGDMNPRNYLENLRDSGTAYNGFNLLAGKGPDLFYYTSRTGEIRELLPGLYGLSNRFLDTPWPKVEKGKREFGRLASSDIPDKEAIFDLLADRSVPPDDRLPQTGVGIEWERILSPLFIESEIYGTRSSSVLLVGKDGQVRFTERIFIRTGGKTTVEKTQETAFRMIG